MSYESVAEMGMPVAPLEPEAIDVTQDAVIGMAKSAPAGTVAATLATLAAVTAYGNGAVLLTAIRMLIVAKSYRKLNKWNEACSATFEWVGRAINPYLGFLTGWAMIAGYIITTVAEVVVLGPSVLTVFGDQAGSTWAYVWIDTGLCVLMLLIAVLGIRLTARTQIVMSVDSDGYCKLRWWLAPDAAAVIAAALDAVQAPAAAS